MTTVAVEEQTIDVTVVEDTIILNVYGGVPSSGGASDVDDLTTESGTDGQYVNVATDGGLQYRDPADVLSDIGAETAGSAQTVQGNLDTHEGDATNPHSVTAAQVGADESGNAAIVAGALSDHAALSTTAHGGIVADNDGRLADARTPTVHASSHATGEDDAIAAADIGAEPTITGGTSTQVWNGLKAWVTRVALDVAQTWTAVQTFSPGLRTGKIYPEADSTTAILFNSASGNQNIATVDTTNLRLHVGAPREARFSVVSTGGTPFYLSGDTSSGAQVIITGYADENKRMRFGYSTTENAGKIQAIYEGVALSPLHLNSSGGGVSIGVSTTTANLDIAASTSANASLRLRDGVAPNNPNDGDIWQDGTDLLIRIGGTTYTLDKTAA